MVIYSLWSGKSWHESAVTVESLTLRHSSTAMESKSSWKKLDSFSKHVVLQRVVVSPVTPPAGEGGDGEPPPPGMPTTVCVTVFPASLRRRDWRLADVRGVGAGKEKIDKLICCATLPVTCKYLLYILYTYIREVLAQRIYLHPRVTGSGAQQMNLSVCRYGSRVRNIRTDVTFPTCCYC